jgi:hypothetical protein
MSAASPNPRQGPIAAWVAQMIGTLVLAGVVLYIVRSHAISFGDAGAQWKQWTNAAILLGIAPALLYLGHFKVRLDADETAVRQKGAPDPAIRVALMKSLSVGGALCEIPMAMGVVHLLLGGETRWFLGATLITIALRLSYRPFSRRR